MYIIKYRRKIIIRVKSRANQVHLDYKAVYQNFWKGSFKINSISYEYGSSVPGLVPG